jgi:hypothetical protein
MERNPMSSGLWTLAVSIAAGVGLSFAAPTPWHVTPFHGAMLGSALYLGALRKPKGSLRRAATFLALAAVEAYVLFEAAPEADLRASFVILSTWIVLETTGGWNARSADDAALSPVK